MTGFAIFTVIAVSRQAEAWIASSLSLPAMTLMRRIPE
jgi:hypothetical protein